MDDAEAVELHAAAPLRSAQSVTANTLTHRPDNLVWRKKSQSRELYPAQAASVRANNKVERSSAALLLAAELTEYDPLTAG